MTETHENREQKSALTSFKDKLVNTSTKTKVIAGVVALALVGGASGGAVALSHYQTQAQCSDAVSSINKMHTTIDSQIKDAKAKSDSLTISDDETDLRRVYLKGFDTDSEGKNAIDAFNKAVADLETANKANTKVMCKNSTDLSKLTDATKSLKAKSDALKSASTHLDKAMDAYATKAAIADAKKQMSDAKARLAEVQTEATTAMAEASKDPKFTATATAEGSALKEALDNSRSLSTDDTAKTFDEAVAVLNRAKKIDKASKTMADATNVFTKKFDLHQSAKAAAEAAKAEAEAKAKAAAQQRQARSTAPAKATPHRATARRNAPAPRRAAPKRVVRKSAPKRVTPKKAAPRRRAPKKSNDDDWRPTEADIPPASNGGYRIVCGEGAKNDPKVCGKH